MVTALLRHATKANVTHVTPRQELSVILQPVPLIVIVQLNLVFKPNVCPVMTKPQANIVIRQLVVLTPSVFQELVSVRNVLNVIMEPPLDPTCTVMA